MESEQNQNNPSEEQQNDLKTDPSIEDVIDNDEDIDESEDSETMPPLESIENDGDKKQKDSNTDSVKKDDSTIKTKKEKNIVIEDEEEDKSNDPYGYSDILNNGDLRKKIIKQGSGTRPQRGSKVAIKLETRIYNEGEDEKDVGTGTLISEETFDRFILVLGDNDLHQGLDLMIPLMELNETCRAIIKPRFSYGTHGNKSIGIPENTTLDCTIELLEILTPNDNPYGVADDDNPDAISEKEPLSDRIKFGSYKKTRGNFWFERGEYSSAIQCYRGALKYLDANGDELKMSDEATDSDKEMLANIEDLIDKRAQTFNNLAAAQMKLQAFDAALRSVKDSLILRPENVKALFRHAKILTEMGELEEAISELKKANKIDPKSEAVALELDRLNRILAKQLKNQKELYRRMMQTKTDDDSNLKSKNLKQNGKQNSQCDKQTKINNKDSKQVNQNSGWSKYGWPVLGASVVLTVIGAIVLQTFKQ